VGVGFLFQAICFPISAIMKRQLIAGKFPAKNMNCNARARVKTSGHFENSFIPIFILTLEQLYFQNFSKELKTLQTLLQNSKNYKY
jgi:hypothetical protein